jgi:hypothetical protein
MQLYLQPNASFIAFDLQGGIVGMDFAIIGKRVAKC